MRPVMGGEDFTATIAETRAELDGVAVLWNDADELTIFTRTAHNRHYKVKSLSNGNRSATFGYVGFSGNDGSAIENNYAVYPYDADATLAGEVITTKINAEQVYNAEKVDLSNALMAAKSTSSALQFVNSTALMRFDVANNMPDSYTLSSIKLVSAANKIAGEATINLSTDSKAVVTENGVNEVTLSGIDTPITAEKQAFYVVLPATSFAAKDLTVTFTYAEGVEKSFALPAFDLELGSIKTIAYTINEGEDFEGSTPDSGEDFEGETPGTEAKPANNEIWYTTSDGNVIETYNSINNFGANIVSNTYVDGKGVIKLDGDATQLCEAFEGDETLLTVTLPDSVTTLGGYSFSGCPNLTTINFGNGITTVESNAIYDCPSLSEFSGSIVSDDGYCLVVEGVLFYMLPIDESVTSYSIPNGVQSFNFCYVGSSPNITEVSLPDSLTTLNGFGSFYNSFSNVKQYTGKFASADGSCLIESGDLCYFAPQALTGLTSYSVPNGVTKISTKFPSSSTLTTVTFPDGITAVVYGLLNNCPNMQSVVGDIATEDGKCIVIGNNIFDFVDTKLTSYTIPEGVTAIGYDIFAQFSISLTTITVAESVNTIGDNAFGNANIKEIYFKSTTPATIQGNALFNFFVVDENLKLYVPTEAVDAYKSAWSDYASFIEGYEETTLGAYCPNRYITYVDNYYSRSSGDNIYRYRSYITSLQKSVYEFQIKVKMNAADTDTNEYFIMSSSNSARDSFDGIALSPSGLKFYGTTVSYTYEELGVTGRNDLIELYVSFIDKKISVNGKELEYRFSDTMTSMSSYYLFGEYYRDSDDGVYLDYSGFPVGSQLFFAKCWDSSKNLIYLGQAAEAVNSYTGNRENCWKYTTPTSNGYTFASYEEYGGSDYVPFGGMTN